MEAVKGDSDSKEDAGPGCGRVIAATCCLACGVGLAAYMTIWGSKAVLQPLVKLLPQEPTPKAAALLGSATMGSIVLLLPIWPPLCMAAGLVFGTACGTAINVSALVSAAIVSFVIGRCFFQEHVRGCVERGECGKARRLMLMLEDEGSSLKLATLFRFLVVPMFVRNYAASTLEIPLWKLIVSSVPHSVWISALLASMGDAFQDSAQLLREDKEMEWGSVRWQSVASFSVGVLVMLFLSWYAQREYNRRADEEDARELAEVEARGAAAADT